MTREEIVHFLQRYMPSYDVYMHRLLHRDDDKVLKFYLNDDRQPYIK